VISLFHVAGVLDATSWYSLFSIIFLPINSVINPIIYDSVTRDFICKLCRLAKISLCARAIVGAVKLLGTTISDELDRLFLSKTASKKVTKHP
jgi:hypothetical protein